jgi:hypothetical protein
MITTYPGQYWIKQTSGRLAQVSAHTKTHVVMYWPDRDVQTQVARKQMSNTAKWRPHE